MQPHKPILYALVSGVLILSACSGAPSTVTPTIGPVVATGVATAAPTETSAATTAAPTVAATPSLTGAPTATTTPAASATAAVTSKPTAPASASPIAGPTFAAGEACSFITAEEHLSVLGFSAVPTLLPSFPEECSFEPDNFSEGEATAQLRVIPLSRADYDVNRAEAEFNDVEIIDLEAADLGGTAAEGWMAVLPSADGEEGMGFTRLFVASGTNEDDHGVQIRLVGLPSGAPKLTIEEQLAILRLIAPIAAGRLASL